MDHGRDRVGTMARDWHSLFTTWAKPFSDTDEARAANAARLIGEALRQWPALEKKDFEVYSSGSWRNNTNTRRESDVDVAVVLKSACYSEYPADGSVTGGMLGMSDATYALPQFREDVGAALSRAFGPTGVTAGDKAFDVHENTYRLDADVAVFLEHRRYTGKRSQQNAWLYLSGVEMRPRSDPNKRVINWHQQHYDQGVSRNEVTRRRFKRITRILKRLRDDMVTTGSPAARGSAQAMASFLIECLVFNVPDSCFNRSASGYFDDVKEVIAELWRSTKTDDAPCSRFVEVSGLKWLFSSTQPWKRGDVNDFLQHAWQHVGFG